MVLIIMLQKHQLFLSVNNQKDDLILLWLYSRLILAQTHISKKCRMLEMIMTNVFQGLVHLFDPSNTTFVKHFIAVGMNCTK